VFVRGLWSNTVEKLIDVKKKKKKKSILKSEKIRIFGMKKNL
jgi:hypothetical protein